MIVHLKGDNGRTILEVDTNRVIHYTLPPTGDVVVHFVGGSFIVIDRDEYDKLHEAMNAER